MCVIFDLHNVQIGLSSAMKEVWNGADPIGCYFHFAKQQTVKTLDYLGKENEQIASLLAEKMKQATLVPLESIPDFVDDVEQEFCEAYPHVAKKIENYTTSFHRRCMFQISNTTHLVICSWIEGPLSPRMWNVHRFLVTGESEPDLELFYHTNCALEGENQRMYMAHSDFFWAHNNKVRFLPCLPCVLNKEPGHTCELQTGVDAACYQFPPMACAQDGTSTESSANSISTAVCCAQVSQQE